MALDGTLRRSRRNVLSAAAAAMVGAAAATLAGAQAVLASSDDGKTIHVGDNYQHVRATTELHNRANNQSVVSAVASHGGTALYGFSGYGGGATGESTSGTGVYGASQTGRGVYGWSVGDCGVFGYSSSNSVPASLAWSYGNSTGVQGHSGTSNAPAAPLKTGVYGYANQDATAIGALGESPVGTGILGNSTSGTGILGTSTSGAGVRGNSSSHRGGIFTSPVAQLRLYPASAATHPSSGLVGDLFLDSAGNLWLCKGTTTWVKLG